MIQAIPPTSSSRTSSIASILDKAVQGDRITPEEGLRLFESHDLAAIVRRRIK